VIIDAKPASKQQSQPKKQAEEEKMTSEKPSFEYKEHKTLSQLRMVALSNTGVHVYTLDCSNGNEQLIKEVGFPDYPGAELAKFSPIDGKSLAVADLTGIHVIDVATKQERLKIEKKGIIAFEWSPKESYLISCEKQKENSKNLNVWDAQTGKLIIEFEWKNTAKDGPKSVKFDSEEKFCAR
jgi:uncharacterized protein with WD repeat